MAFSHRRVALGLVGLLLAAGLAAVGTAGAAARPAAGGPHSPLAAAPPGAGPCRARLNDAPTEYPSVQAAVDAGTGPGDVVKVAGTCAGVEQRAGLTQTVYLTKTLALQGGYTLTNWTDPDPIAHPTTLDAQGRGRALVIAGGAATVAGLRLVGGDAARAGIDPYAQNRGGAVYVVGAAATISGCLIAGNTAGSGGGVFAFAAELVMRDSTLTANAAQFMGGGLLVREGTGRVAGTLFYSNTAGMGAGAYLASEWLTLTNNAFLSNTARWEGGGVIVEVYGGRSELVGNTVAGNRAYLNGGGLYFGEEVRARPGRRPVAGARRAERLRLAGNVVTRNWTPGNGGGVYMGGDGGAADLVGNWLADNAAGGDGGGLYLDDSADPTPILSNTLTANVAGRNGGGLYLATTTATVRGNLIRGNRAGADGGGGYGPATWTGNTIAGNTAAAGGGGLALGPGDAEVAANVIALNEAARGGGLLLGGQSEAVLINNWIVDNVALGEGGGLLIEAARPRLAHNTLARNAGGSGVDVRGASTAVLTGTLVVSHTVGVRVEAGSAAFLEATLWGNDTDWAGAGLIATGTVSIWGDAAFIDAGAGDYHLGPGSAAIDRGVSAGITTDIDGDPRPMGAGYDIGADERRPDRGRIVYLPLVWRRGYASQ